MQVGEIVHDRYEVFATHGRGVFSSVLRARDRLRKDAEGGIAEVAIKVIRANETMTKARTLPHFASPHASDTHCDLFWRSLPAIRP